ncbi:pyridoxamine-phosphate oxidase [Starmerella bacillaris]|uniref:pyridoxal 5'-phosphate synthase n=1 Tax=Starmerella bacillaris TaxID=1247836 RepID=A0AAV5RJI2_STABA|nr:pyridoxamine-phosphate oxidase [Starmerella bacillaris]
MSFIKPIETHQYTKGHLTENDIGNDPVEQFKIWFEDAKKAKIDLPEALSLATCELPSGKVSDRIVLMKGLDVDGKFSIYSNWGTSHKAKDLESNPNVSLMFWWKELERMVRVEGTATRMTREESEVYFQQRPRGSQIGAWTSKQSQPLESRAVLEEAYQKFADEHKDEDPLPCPPFWGGIKVEPARWEFWQGGSYRVHDRFEFTRATATDSWTKQRISP